MADFSDVLEKIESKLSKTKHRVSSSMASKPDETPDAWITNQAEWVVAKHPDRLEAKDFPPTSYFVDRLISFENERLVMRLKRQPTLSIEEICLHEDLLVYSSTVEIKKVLRSISDSLTDDSKKDHVMNAKHIKSVPGFPKSYCIIGTKDFLRSIAFFKQPVHLEVKPLDSGKLDLLPHYSDRRVYSEIEKESLARDASEIVVSYKFGFSYLETPIPAAVIEVG